jgi:hypothetical protein
MAAAMKAAPCGAAKDLSQTKASFGLGPVAAMKAAPCGAAKAQIFGLSRWMAITRCRNEGRSMWSGEASQLRPPVATLTHCRNEGRSMWSGEGSDPRKRPSRQRQAAMKAAPCGAAKGCGN